MSHPMRIGLVAPLFESVPPKLYGGTERVVHNLCRGLTQAGFEVFLFSSGDSSAPGNIIPVIDEALRLRAKSVRDALPYNLKMLSMVEKSCRDLGLNVVHNHHDYWLLPLSSMTEVPLLTTLHGRMDLSDIPAAFESYPNCFYVSISDSQRTGMPGLKWVRTIHNGIDASEFQFHERQGSYLAFLGRMNVEKRPEWAIQIAKDSGIPLKMAAKIEGQESQQYFETFVKPHVDGKFIEYVGEISEREKSEFLGNALALAFPIDWPEPFGLVMIESLACGTPVLARPCGAASEVLRDGITGYCHRDVSELARHLKNLDILKIDRLKCRQWVEERFSLKRMTEEYVHVYRHVAEFASLRLNRHRRDFLYPIERASYGDTKNQLQG